MVFGCMEGLHESLARAWGWGALQAPANGKASEAFECKVELLLFVPSPEKQRLSHAECQTAKGGCWSNASFEEGAASPHDTVEPCIHGALQTWGLDLSVLNLESALCDLCTEDTETRTPPESEGVLESDDCQHVVFPEPDAGSGSVWDEIFKMFSWRPSASKDERTEHQAEGILTTQSPNTFSEAPRLLLTRLGRQLPLEIFKFLSLGEFCKCRATSSTFAETKVLLQHLQDVALSGTEARWRTKHSCIRSAAMRKALNLCLAIMTIYLTCTWT